MAVTESPSGRIFTFYSYKGGTGRSMAVANLACWLMREVSPRPLKVLVMDWDLEAPGLHRYFAERAEQSDNIERPGVINYFHALQKRLRAAPEIYERLTSDEGWKVLGEEFPLDEYLIRDVVDGVDLIKAGRFNTEYTELVSTFNWVEFYGQYGAVLESFRNLLMSSYDFCLIDSRTGFNDISGICTMLMPEKLITVFTPNRQNLSGVLDLSSRAIDYRRSSGDFRPLSIFPLPSRIENAEQALRQDWRKQYQQEFEFTFRHIYQLQACDLGEYFDEVQLPHVAYYAYGEEVALLKERSEALSLSRAYELFFDRLKKLDFAWDRAEPERVEVEPVIVIPSEVERAAMRTAAHRQGILTDYESGIFISYAHVDNDRFAEGNKGWVDYLHERLATRLTQLLGKTPAIWRDPKLTGNDIFTETLILTLSHIAIMVPIISPRYVRAEGCLMELKEFYRIATKSGGIRRQNKAPIFKVVKTPIEESKYPEELRELLGYKFYEVDPHSGRPREFSHEMMFDTYPKFLQRVDDLAWDIKTFIESSQTTRTGMTVYLAVTGADIETARDKIKRELQYHGYMVLPDRDFPTSPTKLEEAIREDLRRSDLSIHLIGDQYDDVTRQMPQSIVRLQYELAVERGRAPDFAQVVWMPRGLKARDDEQQALIDYLRSDVARHSDIEVLQDKLEDLKTNVLAKLKSLMRPESLTLTSAARDGDESQEPVRIYLIHDSQDYDASAQLRNFLFAQSFQVISPVMEGEASEVLQDHKENLQDCDAAIVFYGQASEIWMQQKLRELRKIIGLGRTTELLGKALYISAPLTKQKENFRSLEVKTLRDEGEFPPPGLLQFLQEVQAKALKLKAQGAL